MTASPLIFRVLAPLGAILCLSNSLAIAQTTWHVNDNGPGDPAPGNPFISDPLEDGTAAHPFDRIQEGINAGATGDIVLVQDGTYFEFNTLDLSGGQGAARALWIHSANGPTTTILDATSLVDQVAQAVSGETLSTVFEGFTLRGGSATVAYPDDRGGGLRVENSSVTLRNCVFESNAAKYGGGLYTTNSSTVVENCVFEGNQATSSGGAIYFNSGNNRTTSCTFQGNTAAAQGGAVFSLNAVRTVEDCLFYLNTAGGSSSLFVTGATDGIAVSHCRFISNSANAGAGVGLASDTLVDNCLFASNESVTATNGAVLVGSGASVTLLHCTIAGGNSSAVNRQASAGAFQIRNCVLWTNHPTQIEGSGVSVQYSNVFNGSTGTGNINANPLFKNPLGRDGLAGTLDDNYQLLGNSPSVDAADTYFLATTFASNGDPLDLNGIRRAQDLPGVPNTGVTSLGLAADQGCYEVQGPCIQTITAVHR